MDEALTNALTQRNILKSKISEAKRVVMSLDKDLFEVEKFISDWHRFAGSKSGESEKVKKVVRSSGNPRKEDILAKVLHIIHDAGRPVSRVDLMNQLKVQGVNLNGADPMKVLSTMLWRMKEKVVHLRGYGYWPAEKRYSPANYDGRGYIDGVRVF